MTRNQIIVVVMFGIGLILSLNSCVKQEQKRVIQPIEVETLVVDSMQSGLVRTYVGEVEESASVSLSFMFGGSVQKVLVHDGDQVRKGQLLVVIDKQNAQNSYNAAKATWKQAEDGYKRLKQVYEQGSVAEVKWVEMQTTLEKARSTAEIAKKQLLDCELYAPDDGVVGSCDAKVGGNLLPGQTAVKLLDMQSVHVAFSVPESEVSSIKLGRTGVVTVFALDNAAFTGEITDRSLTANRVSHSYLVKITLSNPQQKLLPGMVCKVALPQPNSAGFAIPAKAVQIRPEGLSVWMVSNNKAVRRSVESNEFIANGVLVTKGLQQGDTLIVTGYQKLYDNATIIIKNK